MRNRILHLADLHLGAEVDRRLSELSPEQASVLREAREGLLDRLADWVAAPESSIGLVIIAGDLFHRHNPDEETLRRTRLALARMAACVPVVTVPGNHDEYSYPDCVYRTEDWPGVLVRQPTAEVVWEGPLEDTLPIQVVAVAYEAGRSEPGQIVMLPPVDSDVFAIAAIHGTLEEYISGPVLEGERCFRVRLGLAASAGYRYLALGHIHRPARWDQGSCTAVYPGPPVGPSSRDPGSERIVCVDIEKGKLRLGFEDDAALLGWRWHRRELQVQAGETPEAIVTRARLTPVERGAYLVQLQGQIDREDFAERLEEQWLGLGIVAVVDDRTARLFEPPDLEVLLTETTLAGEFVRVWQEWRNREGIDEEFAKSVLLEGLSALSNEE